MNPEIASPNRLRPVFLMLGLLLLVAAFGCGGTSSTLGTTKAIRSIAATPAKANIQVGASEQFTAMATYTDNSTADVTSSVTWTDADSKIATVGGAGKVTALAPGTTTVTAAMDGLTASASLTVSAAPKTLHTIAIKPASVTLVAGTQQQLTATATYSDSSTGDVSKSVAWTSSDPAVATISAAGVVSAVAAGSATITASLNGVTATAAVAISAPARVLHSIALSPATATIAVGATQQFAALATYNDGSTADITASATWSSSAPGIASMNGSGLATAVAAGSATITATLSGVHARASLTVPPASATLSAIVVSPPSAQLAIGAAQQFTAMASYSDGSSKDVTASVLWSSSSPTAATINASGLATAVAAGSSTITAALSGTQGTAALTVTPSLTSISVSPNPASIASGATQQFTATATYSDNSTRDITATATWISSDTSIATVSSAGLATAVAAGSATITASCNGVHGSATLNVTGISSIVIAPKPASFAMNTSQQLTATAKYSDGATVDITSQATWSAANTAVATVNANGLAMGVAAGSTTITASYNGTTGTLPITVTLPAGAAVNIPTWHVDNNRSGLNSGEVALTPANVAPRTFGKLFSYLLDGYAYAEPLLISNVTINGSVHNVLYVSTERDSVYAFDADNYGSGAPLWQTSLLQAGETPITGAPIKPYEGITSTPVIDPVTNTIYVVSQQSSSATGATYRLNALDITTGKPKAAAVTITASVPGTNSSSSGGVVSLPGGCIQRAALLLSQGTIYIGFGSCHEGWLLAYDASSLHQVGVFSASPNIDGEGPYASAGGVWMGSGGPVADSAGNVYISTGNGPWDGQTAWADSMLKFNPKLTPNSSGAQVQDYFTPQDYLYMDCDDSDLAAGGLMMVPGTTQIVGGGKMGKLYMVNTAAMGHEQAGDAGITSWLYVENPYTTPYVSSGCPYDTSNPTATINSYEIFGTAAYFNGSIYLGVTPTSSTATAGVRHIQYSSGQMQAQEVTAPSIQQGTRGTTPFITANQTSDGVLWMIDEGQPIGSSSPTTATLRAYDPLNLNTELYDSNQNPGDVPGYGIKFSSPVAANGKVYISTGHDLPASANPQGEIDVYGLK